MDIINHVMVGDLVGAGNTQLGEEILYATQENIKSLQELKFSDKEPSESQMLKAFFELSIIQHAHQIENFINLENHPSVLSDVMYQNLAQKNDVIINSYRMYLNQYVKPFLQEVCSGDLVSQLGKNVFDHVKENFLESIDKLP
ncbi:hypothetical protein GKC56_02320 [Neisseriaceae bacterium PsAf]|nr:hypothetical protein [Neisseriaceae bacterium PsAf]